MYAKAAELSAVDEAHEADVRCWGDALVEFAVIRDRVAGVVEQRPVDVGGVGDIEEVGLPVINISMDHSLEP